MNTKMQNELEKQIHIHLCAIFGLPLSRSVLCVYYPSDKKIIYMLNCGNNHVEYSVIAEHKEHMVYSHELNYNGVISKRVINASDEGRGELLYLSSLCEDVLTNQSI